MPQSDDLSKASTRHSTSVMLPSSPVLSSGNRTYFSVLRSCASSTLYLRSPEDSTHGGTNFKTGSALTYAA